MSRVSLTLTVQARALTGALGRLTAALAEPALPDAERAAILERFFQGPDTMIEASLSRDGVVTLIPSAALLDLIPRHAGGPA